MPEILWKIKRGNAVYLAEVENVRVDGNVIQRHLRYVGKAVDSKLLSRCRV